MTTERKAELWDLMVSSIKSGTTEIFLKLVSNILEGKYDKDEQDGVQ